MQKLFLAILFNFSIIFSSYSQKSLLEKRISLSVGKEPVVSVLEKIEHLGDFSFSFNGALFNKNRVVSFTVSNKKIIDILRIIIDDHSLVYREHGDQIIIYRPRQGDSRGIAIHRQPKIAKENQKIETIYDTIVDYKEYTLMDTIKVYDTVTVIDTIKIKETPKLINNQVNKNNQNWLFSYSTHMFLPLIQYKALRPEQEQAVTILNNSGKGTISPGVSCGISYGNHLRINTGLGIQMEKESFNIQKKFNEIKFSHIQTDTTIIVKTISTYYEYSGGDTIWHTIYDTTKTIKSTNIYDTINYNINYKKTNIALHLTIPLYVSYNYFIKKNFSLGFNFGITTQILIYSKGNYLQFNNGKYTILYKQDFTKVTEQLYVAPTVTFLLKSNYSIKIEPYVVYGLQSTFSTSTGISRMFNYMGLSLVIVK